MTIVDIVIYNEISLYQELTSKDTMKQFPKLTNWINQKMKEDQQIKRLDDDMKLATFGLEKKIPQESVVEKMEPKKIHEAKIVEVPKQINQIIEPPKIESPKRQPESLEEKIIAHTDHNIRYQKLLLDDLREFLTQFKNCQLSIKKKNINGKDLRLFQVGLSIYIEGEMKNFRFVLTQDYPISPPIAILDVKEAGT